LEMSYETMGQATRAETETAHQKLVLLMLASHLNDKTGQCNPSINTLAFECVMAPTTVKTALAGLERLGLIRRVSGKHSGKSNIYSLWITKGEGSRHTPTQVVAPRLGGSRQATTKQEIETVISKQSLLKNKDEKDIVVNPEGQARVQRIGLELGKLLTGRSASR
jgi:DNA-binding transcriptional regulator YhcF (GntR family)